MAISFKRSNECCKELSQANEYLRATITEQAARIKALEGALRDACVALTRQTRQTHRWQNLYGGYYPKWIPPVHDVIVAELSQQAISAINELIGE